ncbi:MAG: VOC family protein [Holophagae bacterium]|nr:VOC family protein [Holophagae bacterium]
MKAVRHTGIVVTDMERALEFYRDLLGLKPVIDFEEAGEYIDTVLAEKGVRVRMVKLVADDGGMVELLHFISHPMSRAKDNKLYEIGPTHMAYTVDSIDETYERLSDAGVRFNSAPVVSPDGKAKLAFCQDPDITYLELVEMLPEGN